LTIAGNLLPLPAGPATQAASSAPAFDFSADGFAKFVRCAPLSYDNI
jgi:hypothetical protein